MRSLVVSDRPVVAKAVGDLLAAAPDVEVQVSTSAEGCRHAARTWEPRVAVVDLRLSLPQYQQLCSDLHALTVASVCLVGGADEGLGLLEAGAGAILTSGGGLDEVAKAVRTVLDGHTYVPTPLLGGVLQGLIRERRNEEARYRGVSALSEREKEVLTLLGLGRDVPEIARRLSISPETTKTHIRHVLHKLGVRSRVEAAALAVEVGLAQQGGPT